jgi:hypothetical protein
LLSQKAQQPSSQTIRADKGGRRRVGEKEAKKKETD